MQLAPGAVNVGEKAIKFLYASLAVRATTTIGPSMVWMRLESKTLARKATCVL